MGNSSACKSSIDPYATVQSTMILDNATTIFVSTSHEIANFDRSSFVQQFIEAFCDFSAIRSEMISPSRSSVDGDTFVATAFEPLVANEEKVCSNSASFAD